MGVGALSASYCNTEGIVTRYRKGVTCCIRPSTPAYISVVGIIQVYGFRLTKLSTVNSSDLLSHGLCTRFGFFIAANHVYL